MDLTHNNSPTHKFPLDVYFLRRWCQGERNLEHEFFLNGKKKRKFKKNSMTNLEQRKLPKTGKRQPKHKLATKSSNDTWAKKMAAKEKLQRVKALSKQLKDQIHHEQETARAARRANRQRKEDNERKNMVVQEIKNLKAVKKLSPKQRRRARIYLKHEL